MKSPAKWQVEYATATPRTWTVYQERDIGTGGVATWPVATITDTGLVLGSIDARNRLQIVGDAISTTMALHGGDVSTEDLHNLIVTTLSLID